MLNKLPVEILGNIYKYLSDRKDLINQELVCTQTHRGATALTSNPNAIWATSARERLELDSLEQIGHPANYKDLYRAIHLNSLIKPAIFSALSARTIEARQECEMLTYWNRDSFLPMIVAGFSPPNLGCYCGLHAGLEVSEQSRKKIERTQNSKFKISAFKERQHTYKLTETPQGPAWSKEVRKDLK